MIGISGSLIWSKPLMELIFNPVVNFAVVRRTQLAKFVLLTSTLVPPGSFQIFKVYLYAKERESGVRKATENYRTHSIPGKTEALVPEFAVEDLPSAELQPRFLRLQ